MQDRRVAGDNDSVFQNQHPNLLIGCLLKPYPVCRVSAESLLQAGDILTAIADLFAEFG